MVYNEYVIYLLEDTTMTDNEIKLISLISNADNPEEALEKAIEIIISFLKLPQSFLSTSLADSQEQGQTSQEVCVASLSDQPSPWG